MGIFVHAFHGVYDLVKGIERSAVFQNAPEDGTRRGGLGPRQTSIDVVGMGSVRGSCMMTSGTLWWAEGRFQCLTIQLVQVFF